MSYKVLTTTSFERQYKKLAKKYPSLKTDILALRSSLMDAPKQGSPLGQNTYKIRLAISSKGKGKSGGARVITYLHVIETSVYLLTIYDKSDQEIISNEELEILLAKIK